MDGLSKKIEEGIDRLDILDRDILLDFIKTNGAQIDKAVDEDEIEELLNRELSGDLITQDSRNNIISFVKKIVQDYINSVAQPALVGASEKLIEADKPVSELIRATDETKKPLHTAPVTKELVFSVAGGLFWLVALYFLATWVSIGSLSSIQFRDDIDQKYHATLLQVKNLKNREEVKKRQEDIDNYQAYMLASVAEWEGDLTGIAVNLGTPLESLKQVSAVKEFCGEENIGKDALKNKACDELRIVLTKYLPYLASKKVKEDALKMAEDAYEKDNGNPERNSLGDLQVRIQFMERFGYWPMLVMPDQVLTLLLAIAMGVLGSTITMTWTFLEEKQNPPLRWYLLRPFVGALSALIIFIFAKAGQMTLTVNQGNATLSPFLLSLLGIASGLLSDRAYAQMSLVSGKFIGDIGAEHERWSSHLMEELEKKQMTTEQLATALKMDKQQVDLIVNNQRKASSIEQQRISDYLGVNPRFLFTDIPP